MTEKTAEYVRRLRSYLIRNGPSASGEIKKAIGCEKDSDFREAVMRGTYLIPGLYEDSKGSGSEVVYGINSLEN